MLLPALLVLLSLTHGRCSPVPGARPALHQDWFTMALNYINSNPETLEELLGKERTVSEGDVILSDDRNAMGNIWPTLEIPYVIAPELERRRDDVLQALAMLEEHTCLTFHQRTSETNYLLFESGKGCASYVGFIGGEQSVIVGPPCIVGNIVHEVLHALGFHHEHTRPDREKHITILHQNIMPGMERNFMMQHGQTFQLDYDPTSIMHYGSGSFSTNGLPTIVAHGDQADMGQRVKMTETDIERVRRLYHCDSPKEGVGEGKLSAEEEADAIFHFFGFRLDAPPGVKPEDVHTSAEPLQRQSAATRGHNHTVSQPNSTVHQ